MSREEWRKNCDCKVVGCVENDTTISTAREGDVVRVIATFHGGPCCPKCHKPWKHSATYTDITVSGLANDPKRGNWFKGTP